MEEKKRVEESNKWLESLSRGGSQQLEALTLSGLRILESHGGYIRCRFVVSDRITNRDGSWNAGAMATLIDDVGAAAILSLVGHVRASLDFSISYYSPVFVDEVVEIEAKVYGNKDRLSSVVIEVRKKESGELVALGKQWMAQNNIPTRPSKL